MGNHSPRRQSESGFSLLELLMSLLVIGIVSGMALVTIINVLPTLRADGGMQLVLTQLRQARQSSVDQRRNFAVTFVGTNRVTVVRQETGGGTTAIADYFFPYQMITKVYSGLPDTPDNFGKANAVNFNGNVVVFVSDGTAVDSTGALINGTVFLGIGNNPMTARAVTVMGGTGRIRSYRYNGTAFR